VFNCTSEWLVMVIMTFSLIISRLWFVDFKYTMLAVILPFKLFSHYWTLFTLFCSFLFEIGFFGFFVNDTISLHAKEACTFVSKVVRGWFHIRRDFSQLIHVLQHFGVLSNWHTDSRPHFHIQIEIWSQIAPHVGFSLWYIVPNFSADFSFPCDIFYKTSNLGFLYMAWRLGSSTIRVQTYWWIFNSAARNGS